MKFKKSIIGLALIGILNINTSFAEETKSKVPLKEISKIAEIFSLIDQYYIEDANKEEILIDAIKGMVSSLDPYSQYLEKEDFQALQDDVSGEMVGIGVVLKKNEKGLEIETVVKDGSVSKTNIQSGDIIVKVGDKRITKDYKNPFESIKDIKGEEGTKVKLSIYRAKNDEIVVYEIERAKFTADNVFISKLDHDYSYITFRSFQENTTEQLKEALNTFNKQNPNTKGYVLDLRSNPGGLLNSAIDISDMFLDDGLIVSTKGRDGEVSEDSATSGDLINGKPIVVLINSGTASAAEIVAGALQDNERALIVGQTSYGKGSVQTVLPLNGNDGDGLKLTVARYYTPSGRSIQAEGIVPDIKLQQLETVVVSKVKSSREKDNEGHISNDTEYTSKDDFNKDDIETSIEKDYALFMATNTLKTLTFKRSE